MTTTKRRARQRFAPRGSVIGELVLAEGLPRLSPFMLTMRRVEREHPDLAEMIEAFIAYALAAPEQKHPTPLVLKTAARRPRTGGAR